MRLTRRGFLGWLLPSTILTVASNSQVTNALETKNPQPNINENKKNEGRKQYLSDNLDNSKLAHNLQSKNGADLVGTKDGETVSNKLDSLDKLLSNIKREDGFYKSTFSKAALFNIPSDYSTLQEAFDELYIQTTSQGNYIILNIEAGHKIAQGVKVQHGDFSRFYIQSSEPIVSVAHNFVGVCGPDGKGTITDGTVIMAYHARGPVLGCIIDGRKIARTLYLALGGSHGWSDRLSSPTEESPNKIKIAGGQNFLHATFLAQEGSVINCENSLAINCHLNSIYCERNSTIHAEFSDVSNARQGGVVVTRGGMVNADTVIANGCTVGFWAHRQGVISASDSIANNCSGNGYRADTGGRINAHNSSASNTSDTSPLNHWKYGGAGYLAFRGGEIVCTGKSKANNCIYGLMAIFGSVISAFQITANNCKNSGVSAAYGSRIEADEANIGNCGKYSVHAADGSSISLKDSIISNSVNNSIFAESGSNITANAAKVSNSGTICVYAKEGSRIDICNAVISGGAEYDVKVNSGAIISANDAKFTKLGNALNEISANGIVFG